MRLAAHSYARREQPWLFIAEHSLEGHADAKVLCDAVNHSKALAGMLPDGIAVKKRCDR
jgi:hypothetical protein